MKTTIKIPCKLPKAVRRQNFGDDSKISEDFREFPNGNEHFGNTLRNSKAKKISEIANGIQNHVITRKVIFRCKSKLSIPIAQLYHRLLNTTLIFAHG